MKFNKLKLLIKIEFLSILPIFLFFISCASTTAEEPQEVKTVQSYDINDQLKEKYLAILPQDVENISDIKGFVWHPFILPLQNYTQTNASLLLGMMQNPYSFLPQTSEIASINSQTKKIIPPPKEGECVVFDDTPVLNQTTSDDGKKSLSTQKKLFNFVNINKQKLNNTSLYFVLDGKNHLPVAVGRLDVQGKSKCFLPSKPYSISVGYGRYRYETHINGQSRIVNIRFPKISTLRVRTIPGNDIKNGDLIRIGRKFNLDFANKHNSDFPEFHLESKIKSDLYIDADMQSHDLSIDEYLKTSFLVGKSPYQIELESGNYVVAVLRKEKLVCFNTFHLKPDMSREINCATAQQKSSDDIMYQFTSEDSKFDVGFRPSYLLKNSAFIDWNLDTPGTTLLGPPLIDNVNNLNQSSIQKNDFFSILFKKNPFSAVQQTSYGASFSESINTFKVPLKGMSLKDLVNGQVPFSEYVRARSRKYLVPYFLNTANVMYTNGAEISILEPVLTNKGTLFATSAQDFMIRVFAPKWNSSFVIEAYINGSLFKRWLLERGDLSLPFSTTLKINTLETDNFLIKFVVRGQSPLPNFLTGRSVFLPYAETREFCVSLDGKDQCL